ncbi:MAG: DUF2244 domain-containing protein [Methyloceanibacter sp.]|uniref:DUF2244 domain-containing protein n=1 Tax=Methyloceanibacter sp. TaxID=1965321 RepID=UPI003D6DA54D
MAEPPGTPQDASSQEPQFRAVLTPHRSLGPKGFMVLMGAICVVSFGTGLMFFLMGAWPVIGFMGLDVALIYIAFKLNFRALRIYETVDLSPEALTVTRVAPNGRPQSWRFNPYWVRLSLEERVGRTSELSLVSHGTRLVLGSFLTDPEREDFAAALRAALSAAKGSRLTGKF